MGHGITIEWTKCDYLNSFFLGIGMMYSSLENVISHVSPNRREKVLNILHYQDIYDVSYEHKMLFCPNCNILAARFDFPISNDDGQTYRPYFRCPECRTILVPLDEPIKNTRCPKCGEKSLIDHATILWDERTCSSHQLKEAHQLTQPYAYLKIFKTPCGLEHLCYNKGTNPYPSLPAFLNSHFY